MAEKDKHHKDLKKSVAEADTASPNKGSEAYNQMRKRGMNSRFLIFAIASCGMEREKFIFFGPSGQFKG
jgi:hypothetical protein